MMAIEYIHKTHTSIFVRETEKKKNCSKIFIFYIVSKIHIPLIENNTFILKVSYKSQVYVFQDKNTCAKKALCIVLNAWTPSIPQSLSFIQYNRNQQGKFIYTNPPNSALSF